jgi:hypothetical protein
MAAANAYLLSRLHHQTTLLEAVADRVAPIDLACCLATVERALVERAIVIGAKEPVAARLIAARVPEAVVKARRRVARKKAKKKGYAPSQAHLTRLAWNLLITQVSETIWRPSTVRAV